MSEKIVYVEFDKEAFQQEVGELVDLAKLKKELSDVIKLKFPSDIFRAPTKVIREIHEFIEVVIAAVEVVKQKYLTDKSDESGTVFKFNGEDALETALDLADSYIVFKGLFGRFFEKYDRPVIALLVRIAVSGKSGNWIQEAKAIIGL